MPDEEFRPDAHDFETPFIFVPHGSPDPVEWKRQHPGWVSFPATFVLHPRPIPKWKVINGQRWPLDRRGPWPKTRYGRPTCPFDELPPNIPAPGTQYELMRKLDHPTLFWEGEPMPTVAEVLAIGAEARAERAAAAPPPPVQRPKAYDGDGIGPVRDYLEAMNRVSDTMRQAIEDTAYWRAEPSERLAMSDSVLDRNGAAALGATRKIGSLPSGAPGPIASAGPEMRTDPQPSEAVLSDADLDPVLEGRQYAAAPLALAPAAVPALRSAIPYVARGLGALLGSGAGVVLNEAAKPSAEEKAQPTTADGNESTPQRVTVSPDRRTHILAGNKNGGGHRPGTGIPGKSELPVDWSDDKI